MTVSDDTGVIGKSLTIPIQSAIGMPLANSVFAAVIGLAFWWNRRRRRQADTLRPYGIHLSRSRLSQCSCRQCSCLTGSIQEYRFYHIRSTRSKARDRAGSPSGHGAIPRIPRPPPLLQEAQMTQRSLPPCGKPYAVRHPLSTRCSRRRITSTLPLARRAQPRARCR